MNQTLNCRQDDIQKRLLKEGILIRVEGTKYNVKIYYEFYGGDDARVVHQVGEKK